MKQQMSNMEFGRRLATERDLEKTEVFNLCNIGELVMKWLCCCFVWNKFIHFCIITLSDFCHHFTYVPFLCI